MELNNLRCCGVKEISELSIYGSPEEALLAFDNLTYGKLIKKYKPNGVDYSWKADPFGRFRYVMFTQANAPDRGPGKTGRNLYGEKFAALITENGLGNLHETTDNINPNSSNNVKVWLWTIDHDATKAFITKLKDPKNNLQNPLRVGGRG